MMTAVADFATVTDVRNMSDLSVDAQALWNINDDETTPETPDRPEEPTPGIILPTAEVGCAQTGTPANLWTDTTGVEWCVVEDQGDYAMLVSRRAHRLPAQDGLTAAQANRNHNTNTFVSWPTTTADTGGPEIRGRVNTWFNNNANVSPELRNSAVHATLPNLNNTLTINAWHNRNADLTALSQPVTETSNGLPFFMSPADLNVRLGNSNANRRAVAPDGTSSRWYWLRPAGNNNNSTVSGVFGYGGWSTTFANSTVSDLGVRPAIWVRR